MDANELLDSIEGLYALGDQLDDSGVAGVKYATDGKFTTREMLRAEIFAFLLDLALTDDRISDDSAALINIFSERDLSAAQLEQIYHRMDPPQELSLSLEGFILGDYVFSQAGVKTDTSCSDLLIRLFSGCGSLLTALNASPAKAAKLNNKIRAMESYTKERMKELGL